MKTKLFLPALLIAAGLAWTLSPAGRRALFGRVPAALAGEGEPAPEFPAGMEWLNTERPFDLKGLRGKVVLLDFWTYGCINCMHLLPELAKLEEKYKDELVVLGVHSAKFSAEQSTARIRQAVMRFQIRHPVLNDRNSVVWDLYQVHAWPTLVLIAPSGRILGSLSGEEVYEPMDRAIAAAVAKAGPALRRGELRHRTEQAPAGGLSFPGKVLADPSGRAIFVADSKHHRIIAAERQGGRVLAVIGSGRAALEDGSFERASFKNPQGLALSPDGKVLYVADTGNHALRAVDLQARTVATLAGDGRQGRVNSPWDLCLQGGLLYVAMAGSHQIVSCDPASGDLKPFAGDGLENLKDGPLAAAELAQTSGICGDGKRLFFADPESSSIRVAEDGRVRTLVGKGLFDFGDEEGEAGKAMLQHPLGLQYHEGLLYVADSYNNRIKTVDPQSGATRFFAGHGLQGYHDGPGPKAEFDEPGGLSIAGGKIYVADTNNQALRVIDMATREVSTFRFLGLP